MRVYLTLILSLCFLYACTTKQDQEEKSFTIKKDSSDRHRPDTLVYIHTVNDTIPQFHFSLYGEWDQKDERYFIIKSVQIHQKNDTTRQLIDSIQIRTPFHSALKGVSLRDINGNGYNDLIITHIHKGNRPEFVKWFYNPDKKCFATDFTLKSDEKAEVVTEEDSFQHKEHITSVKDLFQYKKYGMVQKIQVKDTSGKTSYRYDIQSFKNETPDTFQSYDIPILSLPAIEGEKKFQLPEDSLLYIFADSLYHVDVLKDTTCNDDTLFFHEYYDKQFFYASGPTEVGISPKSKLEENQFKWTDSLSLNIPYQMEGVHFVTNEDTIRFTHIMLLDSGKVVFYKPNHCP